MNLKARINKLVKEFPSPPEQNIEIHEMFYFCSPSEEERNIAMNKANELIVNSLCVDIWYIPYVHKHIFQYSVIAFTNTVWDPKLGLYSGENRLFKLVEKDNKDGIPMLHEAEVILSDVSIVQPGIRKGEMFSIIDTYTNIVVLAYTH